MRRIVLALALSAMAGPLSAQSADPQALADIRSELGSLAGEILALRALTNAPASPTQTLAADGTPLVLRLDRLEEELRQVTGQVEALGFRIDSVVEDGTRRLGDLEFRLVELEGGDIGALAQTSILGGAPAPNVAVSPQAPDTDVSLAHSEQSDFDTALAAYEAGEIDAALSGFRAFLQTYPGGPLAAAALFHIGEAESQQGAHKPAARAYLESFTASPEGPFAPQALMKVGLALGHLGKPLEACQTLAEVLTRYPGNAIEPELMSNRQSLGCG